MSKYLINPTKNQKVFVPVIKTNSKILENHSGMNLTIIIHL